MNKLGNCQLRRRLFIFLFLWWPMVVTAAISVSVDRNPIVQDESVKIVFKSDEALADPDLTPLEKDFEILGTSQSSNVSIINGHMTRAINFIVEAMPKRSGALTIPPIRFAGGQSEGLAITVGGSSPGAAGANSADVFFEVDAQPRSPYVQEQVVYTVRLFRAVNTRNASLSEPTVQGVETIIQTLGEDKTYEMQRGGQHYQVFERRYAIFPQDSGQLTIGPQRFEGIIGGRSGLFFEPFGGRTSNRQRSVRKRSEPITIDVQAIPEAFDHGLWLPAESVSVREDWSEEPPEFKVGEPITRTLTVSAVGLTAAQLPELSNQLPATVKGYPDQPILEDQAGVKGNTGIRQEKIAMIPSRSGEYVLPAIELPWWNTETQAMEYARLAERTLVVQPGVADGRQPEAGGNANAKVESLELMPEDASGSLPKPAIAGEGQNSFWKWLAAFCASGWLVTVLVWWRSRSTSKQQISKETRAAQRFDPRRLKRACKDNDANAAKNALLLWAAKTWPVETPTSLSALALLTSDALNASISELHQSLYGATPKDWQGGERLWQAFGSEAKQAHTQLNQDEQALEPLYKI